MTSHRTYKTALASTVFALAASFAGVAPAWAADMYLSGVVRDAQGPVSGVSVSARAEGSNMTTTVYTDSKGAYYFPTLANGQYHLWAQATSYDLARSDTNLNGVTHQDFRMAPAADPVMQMSGGEILASLPQATPDDKRLQRVVFTSCTGCHPPNFPLQHKFDEAGWTAIINQMTKFAGPGGKTYPTIDVHKKELAAYLARARGPGATSMKITFMPRPTGDAARAVYRTYAVGTDPTDSLPTRYVTNDGTNWSLGTPSKGAGAEGIHDVAADLDGNAWFTYNVPSKFITVGRVDAKTGKVNFYRVEGRGDYAAGSHGITRTKDGYLWFNVNMGGGKSYLGRIDPKTQEIKVIKQDESIPGPGGTHDVDGKGGVWMSARGGALRYDQKAGKFAYFKSLSKFPTYGVAGDRDGNGWWLLMRGDIVAKGDLATGKVTEIKLDPVPGYKELSTPEEMAVYNSNPMTDNSVNLPWIQGPRRGDADLNADVMWVCNWWGDLARIDTHTMKVTYVPLPIPSAMQPYSARVDNEHNVWLAMMNTDQVMKYDPTANKWSAYDIPIRGSETRQLDVLEKDGKTQVFLPHGRTRSIGIMTLRSEHEMQALGDIGAKQKQAFNK